jgi:hypothetical protein
MQGHAFTIPVTPSWAFVHSAKLDQTDHIGRWGGAESECVRPKLGALSRLDEEGAMTTKIPQFKRPPGP